jgi:hypothetical protein
LKPIEWWIKGGEPVELETLSEEADLLRLLKENNTIFLISVCDGDIGGAATNQSLKLTNERAI